MATKIKADLIFQYNLLPVYSDDSTKVDNDLSTYDYVDLMEVVNHKNENEFTIAFLSLDLVNSRISVFSEVWYSETQNVKTWFLADLTSPQQTIINNFINSL